MKDRSSWYIVKQEDGTCDIILTTEIPPNTNSWGAFETQDKAIAKRVGLIRAGKCQPKL